MFATLLFRRLRASSPIAIVSLFLAFPGPALSKIILCWGHGLKCFEIPACAYPACDGHNQPCCFYNVQAAAFPSTIDLTGLLEVPPNGSSSIGYGITVVNTDDNTLTFDITEDVVGETAAHIHGYAGRGVNAGVLVSLPAGAHKVGSWTYPEASEANILNGLTYINIHSGSFPGGEIRGQIEPPYVAPADVPSDEAASATPLLLQLQPNPFASATTVRYSLAAHSDVRLTLYDAGGRQVRVLDAGPRSAGDYYVTWDGSNDQGERVAPAVYYARLETEIGTRVSSLVVLSR